MELFSRNSLFRVARNDIIADLFGGEASRDDDEELLLLLAQPEDPRVHVRQPDYFELWVPKMHEDVFVKLFRVKRSTFFKIVECASNYDACKTSPWNRGKKPISLDKKIIMTLAYLSSQQPMVSIADRFNTCESTVHHVVTQMVDWLCLMIGNVIIWPTLEEMTSVVGAFESISRRHPAPGFPGECERVR